MASGSLGLVAARLVSAKGTARESPEAGAHPAPCCQVAQQVPVIGFELDARSGVPDASRSAT